MAGRACLMATWLLERMATRCIIPLECVRYEKEAIFDAAVWEEFQKQAKKRRRNPLMLITEMMREQIEIREDEQLDKAIRRDVQRSGYTEEDAVELVRQYRREKRTQLEKPAAKGATR